MWPTYADIIQSENKGWAGSGNERIFYFILDEYKKHKFKDYDLITVQWSGPLRFDYKTRDGWTEADGPLRLSKVNNHIWRSLKNIWNDSYEKEKTENYKIVIEKLLESTGKQYHITDMDSIREQYIGDYVFTSNMSWTKNTFTDKHPTITQHIHYANKFAVEYDFRLDKDILSKCFEIHNTISTNKSFEKYTL